VSFVCMIKHLLIWILFIIPYICKAQNLVPNHSIESHTSCPNSQGNFTPLNWLNANTSDPDYFCSCDFQPSDMSFVNISALDSNCFIGLYTSGHELATNGREYVTVQLSQTLVAEQQYCIEFHIKPMSLSKYFIDKIGVLFSDTLAIFNHYEVLDFPERISMSDSIMKDTINWTKLEKKYVASGAENYLTIGNFWHNYEMDSILNSNSGWWVQFSYYYIDKVAVYECPMPEEPQITHHSIYPNPSNGGQFTVEVYDEEAVEVWVHNEIGQLIYYELLPEGATQRSIQLQLASGVYLVSFSRGGVRVKTEKIAVLK
jgi:hypothetical protein